MESSRGDVCNQSEAKYTCGNAILATRDYIRLTAITYQSFGLDKKQDSPKTVLFFGTDTQNGTGIKT